jgi:hypothetical protein
LDTAFLAIQVILLAAVSFLGPGLLIVNKLRWSPLEKLCGALAASFIVVYLVSFGLFLLNAGVWAYWSATTIFALMGFAGRRAARLLIRHRTTRAALIAWAGLLAWYALHLAMVRNYSGADWQGDWHEHYERTQYFLHQFPNDHLFIRVYTLPARPPEMNAIAAFICRQTGLNFTSFSLVFLILNGWTFLPCCLLLSFFTRRARRSIIALALLFMLNPSVVQNATVTWTKAFTAGMAVLGICFYLRRRLVPAALALAASCLAHYSAAPYAVVIGLHSIYQAVRRRQPWRRVILAGASAAALLATWFAFALSVYGPRVTFLSNTTAEGTSRLTPLDNVRKVVFNLFFSAVPHLLHPVPYNPFSPIRNWGDLRDYYFTMAQTVLPNMVGLAGGIVAIGLLIRFFRSPPRPWPLEKKFWLYFLAATYLVGVAVNPGYNQFGNAYVTLQTLALMGVTLVAANLPSLRPWVHRLVCCGLAVDYALGILLEFDRESYVYPTAVGADGQTYLLPDDSLGTTGATEYLEKVRAGYVFLGDHLARAGVWLEISSAILAVGALWLFLRLGRRWRADASPMIREAS